MSVAELFSQFVSSPYKDISMLYQRDLIDDKSLEYLLSEYKIDPLGAKLLMARLLYRCDFFDVLWEWLNFLHKILPKVDTHRRPKDLRGMTYIFIKSK